MRHIATINTGSSSLKIGLYEATETQTRILSGSFERIGRAEGRSCITDSAGKVLTEQTSTFPDHRAALDVMLDWLNRHRPDISIDAIGHRVVHGGPDFREPQRITPELVERLQQLIPIAPNHLPQAVLTIRAAVDAFPQLPQVACFDTAFHRHMSPTAQMYALPAQYRDMGIHRYGFHGLSYEYIVQKLHAIGPQAASGRVIIAHLGNGASMAAVREGIGIDTTMGFTPGGGLVMGTRSGDLDPGVLVYLIAEQNLTANSLSELVTKQSGLLGVSGTSADMRDLLARESFDSHAADAINLFCYQAKKFVGALAAVLGGLDTLVFTGGIGEHCAPVRQRICNGLEFLGIHLDAARNDQNSSVISIDASPATVRVLKTDEEAIIAKTVQQLVPQ